MPMGVVRVLRRRVWRMWQLGAVGAAEGTEVVVETVVLLDEEYDVVDRSRHRATASSPHGPQRSFCNRLCSYFWLGFHFRVFFCPAMSFFFMVADSASKELPGFDISRFPNHVYTLPPLPTIAFRRSVTRQTTTRLTESHHSPRFGFTTIVIGNTLQCCRKGGMPKIGRNSLCRCGSDVKYKHCCLSNDETRARELKERAGRRAENVKGRVSR